MLVLNLALVLIAVAVFVWWAATYEENEDHKETGDHKRKSRKVSPGFAAVAATVFVANIIVYST